ncbi:MAG: hypothetical protein AAF288_10865 [Planctomycetota bacterium]
MGAAVALPAFGQDALIADADQAAWVLRMDVARAFESPLGEELLGHWSDEEDVDIDEVFRGLREASGMDLREDVGEVLLIGSGYEPDAQRVLAARLSESPGRLEGWMLTLPGYTSTELDDDTLLHSFLMENDHDEWEHEDEQEFEKEDHGRVETQRVWAALPRAGRTGPYFAIASTDRDRAQAMALAVREGAQQIAPEPMGEGVVIQLTARNLEDLPVDEDDVGSQVIRSMQAVRISLASPQGEDVTLTVDMSAVSPARGRQISQLLTGLLALPQLAAIEDEDAEDLAEVAQRVAITHTEGSPQVAAVATAEPDEFVFALHLLMEMADDNDDEWGDDEDDEDDRWDDDDDDEDDD